MVLKTRNWSERLLPKWTHLQHSLIIDLVEDGAVDLVGFQCCPVEDGQTELRLYGLLDADGYESTMKDHSLSKPYIC